MGNKSVSQRVRNSEIQQQNRKNEEKCRQTDISLESKNQPNIFQRVKTNFQQKIKVHLASNLICYCKKINFYSKYFGRVLEVLFRFGFWRDFLNNNTQATISAFRLLENMSINPKSVEFHQCHAKPDSICFL